MKELISDLKKVINHNSENTDFFIERLINDYIKEKQNEQLLQANVPGCKINVLVTYYGKRQPWESERPLLKRIFEVEKLTEINRIFNGHVEDIKILN